MSIFCLTYEGCAINTWPGQKKHIFYAKDVFHFSSKSPFSSSHLAQHFSIFFIPFKNTISSTLQNRRFFQHKLHRQSFFFNQLFFSYFKAYNNRQVLNLVIMMDAEAVRSLFHRILPWRRERVRTRAHLCLDERVFFIFKCALFFTKCLKRSSKLT